MLLATSLFIAFHLGIFAAASPLEVHTRHIALPIVKRISTNNGPIDLVKHDQARVAALMERGTDILRGQVDGQDGNVGVTNQAVSYMASVGVGSPPTYYELIVDTGSSNTWVGASKPYVQTFTSDCTGQAVYVPYGSGPLTSYFSGEEWLDTVTLSPDLVVYQQSIGVASSSSGFNTGVDGILGIGPTDLTLASLKNSPSATVPTVTDNLYEQWSIPVDVVSVSFVPSDTLANTNGELTFGGTDDTKYVGVIKYTPVTSSYPASRYWGIDQSITYGSQEILSRTAGIVDTGTTLILLANDAFAAYQSATGGTEDSATGLLLLTAAQYGGLQNLNFNVGSATYSLGPNGQIWPRGLNTYVGGSSGAIYSIVSSTGFPPGQGFDFVNGQTFLERFYSVFDTANQRVGFARTPYTDSNIN